MTNFSRFSKHLWQSSFFSKNYVKSSFNLVVFLLLTFPSFAQFEELKVVGSKLFPSFQLEGKSISKHEVRNFLKRTCPDAVPMYNKSRNKEFLAIAMGSLSLSVLCYEFIDFRDAQKKQPTIATLSALSIATGAILFEFSSRKGFLKTVRTYDSQCRNAKPIDLNFGITPSGGLGMNFIF